MRRRKTSSRVGRATVTDSIRPGSASASRAASSCAALALEAHRAVPHDRARARGGAPRGRAPAPAGSRPGQGHHVAADLLLERRGRPLGDDRPAGEQDQPVAAVPLLHEVGGEQHRHPLRRAATRASPRGRAARPGRARCSARRAAGGAARGGAPWRSPPAGAGPRRAPPPADPARSVEAEALEAGGDPAGEVAAAEAVEMPLVDQVLAHGELEVEAGALEDDAEPRGGPPAPGWRGRRRRPGPCRAPAGPGWRGCGTGSSCRRRWARGSRRSPPPPPAKSTPASAGGAVANRPAALAG